VPEIVSAAAHAATIWLQERNPYGLITVRMRASAAPSSRRTKTAILTDGGFSLPQKPLGASTRPQGANVCLRKHQQKIDNLWHALETRKTVRAMAGYGMPHDDSATAIGIPPATLRKRYAMHALIDFDELGGNQPSGEAARVGHSRNFLKMLWLERNALRDQQHAHASILRRLLTRPSCDVVER
jgi:hypothetical protein